MKLGKRSTLYASIVLATCSAGASAQESLMDVYQRALQNDPVIREAEARLLANIESRPQTRAQLLPDLSLSAQTSFNYSEDPTAPLDPFTGAPAPGFISRESESDSSGWSISLSQSVFNWGQIVSLRQSEKVVTQAETEYEATKQDLLLRVANAYFNVLTAEDALAAQTAARQALERQLEQAQRRFEVGLVARTDVQEAQAGFDQAFAAEIEGQRVLATERERLREIIGESVTNLASPLDDLPLVPPNPENPDEWVRVALDQNLALISARIAEDIANDDIKIARSARLPTLSLSASYSDRESEFRQTTVLQTEPNRSTTGFSEPAGYQWSLNLNVPLFTGGMNSSRIQQSVYQHRASLQASERIARETERLTRDSYLGVVSSIAQVNALRQAVQSSETALRATEAGFEVGTRTSVDVVVSQEQLRQALTNYARARYQYILSTLQLRQATGSLSISDVELVDSWLMQ